MELDRFTDLELEPKIELPNTGTYLFESDIHYLRHSLGFYEYEYPEHQDKFVARRNRYCALLISRDYYIMESLIERGLAGENGKDWHYKFYYITEKGIKALSEYLNTEITEIK